MRILRALPLLLATGGSLLGAIPAHAADSPVTLSLSQRWNAGQQGAWAPYNATVRNDGAADFTGDVTLHPVQNVRGPSLQLWPDYHARINVPHGSERSVTFYVLEPPSGYSASLTDSAASTVATDVTVTGRTDSAYAIAVLSDQPQAGGRIEALRPLASSAGYTTVSGLRASRFGSAQEFPTNAVFLSGLHAVVVDDFDVSTLSDAQIRALRDFVGLGGSLIATGGASWRRTLLPLAQKGLGGLSPIRSGEAALKPLADLANLPTSLTAPIAIGDIAAGRTLVGAPGQPPLVVESAYGAGRIIDVAFDPLAEPVATDSSGLDALAWSVVLYRAVFETAPAGSHGLQSQPATFGNGNSFQGNIGGPVVAASAEEIVTILQNTAAAAVPPSGLLGALLVVYVMLAGPLNYFALKTFGRRELMWVTVPLVALMFTSVAYLAGAAVHGSAYLDNEVQVMRLGPDAVAEVHAYHGLYPPHRGNFTVEIGANTLASTALGSNSNPNSPETAVVDTGARPQVELRGTAYSGFRSLQTLSISRPPLQSAVSLESHLKVAQDRVTGTVRNTGERSIQQLTLVGGTGQQAVIATVLQPRATATVDAALSNAGQATPFPIQSQGNGPGSTYYKRSTLLRVAAGAAVTGRQGDWTLTGLTDPSGSLVVDGTRPAHSGLAAVLAPVALDSIDSLGLASKASVVFSGSTVPLHYDVFDLAIPAGYAGPVKLGYDAAGTASLSGSQSVRSVEVYDWSAGTWRALPTTSAAQNVRSLTADLTAAETKGVVRVRVFEQANAVASNMRLTSS
jgi:hypothetical protein